MSKKMICCMTALLLLSVCLPVLAETAGPVPALLPSVRTPVSGMDSADAFEGYVNRVFGIGGASSITPRNASLTGFNKAIYDLLVPLIEDTAAGNNASSVFTVDVSDAAAQLGIQPDDLMYSPEDLGLSSFYDDDGYLSGEAMNAYYQRAGFNIGTIVHALMVNLPYDLYWFDKTSGFSSGILLCPTDEGEKITLFSNGELTLSMDVAKEFSAGRTTGTTDLNTALTSAASSAAASAQSIVSTKAGLSDFAKLSAYKDAVCQRVSYDQDAADDDDMPYGNPWQLIWVFDDDPDTNVVCEGYSKAFKYLCDLSSFTNPDLSVSIVSGWMSGGTGEGAHMWNLVSMGSGANYLADITNCDEGSVGYPDELFMAGSGRPYSDNGLSGYIFSANGSDIVYAYDGDMAGLYTEAELTVSDTAYTAAEPQIVAGGVCGDNLTWTLDNEGTLTVSGTGEMYGGWNDDENPWADYKAEILHAVVEQGVTSLGLAAFRECMNLTDVSLPDSLTHIHHQALGGCYSLNEIIIPDSVTFIGRWAFTGCPITSITIPAGVTEIEFGAFSYCNQLEEIIIAPGNHSYLVDEEGVLFTADQTKLLWYPIPRTRTSYTVPDTVTTLDGYAFSICNNLHEIILPAGLSIIGASAFDQCQNLTDVYFQGDEDTWSSLNIQDGNGALTDARVYCVQASGSCGENLTWRLYQNGILTVSGTGAMTDYETDTAVPWYGYRNEIVCAVIEPGVTSLGAQAFHNCANMTGVSLPQGLTGIGPCAFQECGGLTGELVIPSSVTRIGGAAFQYCLGLEGNLIIPSSVTVIGDNAFQFCSGLTGLTLPSGLTGIGAWSFHQCTGLVSELALPEELTSISNGAFSGCSGLTGNLTIPSSVTAIGEYAFENCSGLTGLVIPSSVNSIGKCAFCQCTGLVSLTLSEGLQTIGDLAFSHCSGLTGNLTFPSSITVIGNYAFEHCSGLSGNLILPSSLTSAGEGAFALCTGFSGYLQIPGSVLSIVDGAFYECNGLTDIYYAGTANDWYAVAPNSGPYNDAALHFGAAVSASGWFGTGNPFLWILDSRGQLLVRGSGGMESFWDDQDIPWYPYRQDILSLRVTPGVTGIGANAFKQLTRLVSVFLPDGLEYIGGCAFDHCESLPEISLPESVATIEWYSFGSCYELTDIFIPRNLTKIGDAALAYCFKLSQITVDADNPAFTTVDGVLLTMDRTELVCYPPKKNQSTYSVPDMVTTIRAEAFSGCENLSGIFLPQRLESIGTSAFSWCSNLKEIRIPGGVTAIPQKAFSYCLSLTAIHIPASVRNIGNQAFCRCDSLADVYYFGTQPEWNSIIIEDDNESLTNAVLRLILPDLILPAQLTAIESEAFAGVPEGSVIFVPGTVSEIAPDAFDPGTVIITPAGSYAAGWAAMNGFVCFEQ